jgi:hypothetical protein
MAIQVKNLSTKTIVTQSDTTNEYLYLTNISNRIDTKLKLNDLYTYAVSTGNGFSIFTQGGVLNTLQFKSIKSIDTILTVSDGSTLGLSINESKIDLSKCDNLTSLFLSTVSLTANVGSTVLPTANGGTNRSSAWVIGDLAYASATTALGSIAAVATGNALISGGTGTIPSWGKIPLTTHISGTLPVANGGTGNITFTLNGVAYGNNTGALGVSAAGTNGQLLMGGSGAPAFAALACSDESIVFATGSNTLSLSTKIATLQNASGTAGLKVDGSGNLISQANATLAYKRPVVNITASTSSPTAAQSGSIFTLNLAGGITVTLPAAAAGLTYEFHIGTTFSGTLTINAASSLDTLQGIITMAPSLLATATNAGATTAIAGPAAADHQYIADADTKGRLLGTRLKYTAITDAIWLVEGTAVTIGTCATPFS